MQMGNTTSCSAEDNPKQDRRHCVVVEDFREAAYTFSVRIQSAKHIQTVDENLKYE